MLQREFNFQSLMIKDEDRGYRLATGDEIIDAALREISSRYCRGTKIECPADTQELLRLKLSRLEHEVFAVLWLDLCGVPRNVKLGRRNRFPTGNRRRQLHITAATVAASS
jgi:hypothetical protein